MNVATPPKPASVESAVPRLTELARFAGCAAKISQADLHKALAGLPVASDPRVLVGHDTSDDAAIVKLHAHVAVRRDNIASFVHQVANAYQIPFDCLLIHTFKKLSRRDNEYG